MKISLVVGSHRKNSQSLKVANFLTKFLTSEGYDSAIYDLGLNQLPLWDPSAWEKDSELKNYGLNLVRVCLIRMDIFFYLLSITVCLAQL